MIKNKNKSSLIRLLILTTVLLATLSLISTSNALSVNLQPGQSINDITQLALGFDNNAELNLAPGTYSHINDQNINTGSGNVTVRGTNASQKSVIDLQGKNRFFTINSGSVLKLENLIIKNCKVEGWTSMGGTVYLGNGELIINNCEFINNTAGGLGGVISSAWNTNSNVTINNSIFRDNWAGTGGGALCLMYSSTNIYNSKFFNNKIVLGGSHMLQNGGGAVYNVASTILISGCDGYNNSATYGGFIFNTGLTIIHDSMFYNNSAEFGGVSSGSGTLIVNNSYFIANKAGVGGVISQTSSGSVANITFSKFYDNSAINGGAIEVNWGIIDIAFNDFIGNTANYGGALQTKSANIINTLNFFLNNIAYVAGNDFYSY